MTLGEVLELVGIMLGLMIFPGLPILCGLVYAAYWLISKRALRNRRGRFYSTDQVRWRANGPLTPFGSWETPEDE